MNAFKGDVDGFASDFGAIESYIASRLPFMIMPSRIARMETSRKSRKRRQFSRWINRHSMYVTPSRH